MGRIRKELKREIKFRKYNTLFVIATEGEKTELHYFSQFKDNFDLDGKRITLEIIPSQRGESSPSYILKNLDSFKKEKGLNDTDRLWMVIDRDSHSWKNKNISDVATKCQQKKYGLALSNPCFELWVLLHLVDLSLYSDKDKNELEANQRVSKNRTRIEKEILKYTTSYSKKNQNFIPFFDSIEKAIEYSKKLIKNKNDRWPNSLGTHIYKIMEELK